MTALRAMVLGLEVCSMGVDSDDDDDDDDGSIAAWVEALEAEYYTSCASIIQGDGDCSPGCADVLHTLHSCFYHPPSDVTEVARSQLQKAFGAIEESDLIETCWNGIQEHA